MACGETKWPWPWLEILLYSMMTRPARSEMTPVMFRTAWMFVPWCFCLGECVGWRTRIAWVTRRMPAEFRRGWAEKRLREWRNIEAQTVAVSCERWIG